MALTQLFGMTTIAAVLLGTVASAQERHHRHHWDYDFGASVQVSLPQGDLKTQMDNRTGVGIGMQWTGFKRDWWLSRTRFEWNVYPQSHAVGKAQVKTRMENLNLSFDQMVFFMKEPVGPYVFGGLGAVRTFVAETPTAPASGAMLPNRWHTTKLAVTAGLGLRLANQVAVEGRYVVSSLNKTMDANTAQVVVSWYF